MDWTDGSTVFFVAGRTFALRPVYKAVSGKVTDQSGGKTRYIYFPSDRMATAVHGVERVTDQKERERIREEHPDMPDAVFVTYNIAKSVNARRNGNRDCDRKGCLDRYDCIWYNAEKETEPWNKIPKTHVPGEEHCPRCILRQHLNKKGKPKAEKEETVWARWSRAKDEETDRALDILMPMLNHILFDDDATQKDIDELRAEITRLLM